MPDAQASGTGAGRNPSHCPPIGSRTGGQRLSLGYMHPALLTFTFRYSILIKAVNSGINATGQNNGRQAATAHSGPSLTSRYHVQEMGCTREKKLKIEHPSSAPRQTPRCLPRLIGTGSLPPQQPLNSQFPYILTMVNSTRRFRARPSSVSLVAMGTFSPKPLLLKR